MKQATLEAKKDGIRKIDAKAVEKATKVGSMRISENRVAN